MFRGRNKIEQDNDDDGEAEGESISRIGKVTLTSECTCLALASSYQNETINIWSSHFLKFLMNRLDPKWDMGYAIFN